MKRFLKYIILACLPVLASCDAADDGTGVSATRTITVKARATVQIEETRAEVAPVSEDDPAIFSSGLLIFSEPDGTIRYVMRVLPGISGGDVIGINDLTSTDGVTVENIAEECEVIDFFANLPSGTDQPDTLTNIATFRSSLQPIVAIADSDGGVKEVGLYGRGQINNTGKRKCEFDAVAIGSRLEIESFVKDEPNILTYEIEGIFINNFYYRADFTGATDAADLIYYFGGANFEPNGEPYYFSSYKGITFDYDNSLYLGQHSNKYYKPWTASNVWAYNIFAGEVPQLVIKLTGVEGTAALISANGGVDPYATHTYWYITVTGLKDRLTGQSLTSLEQGYVYKIAEIEVSPTTLKPNPGDDINAYVQVNILPWIPVDASTTLPNLPW